MINPMDLSGKKYIVTGASSGLGRQVCVTLSKLGASLSLVARNASGLEETRRLMEGKDHGCYPYDLRNLEGIEALIGTIVADRGKQDGFVHSAGLGTMRPLKATTCEVEQEMMEVNVFSFIEIVRVMTKKANSNAGGSIVAVSSVASKRGGKAKTAYASTKGALDSAVISMAIELGSARKIRVNTVNPAWIETEMYRNYVEEVGREKADQIEARQFLGIAAPGDIANAIAFLLSDACRQITGQSIVIDGGNTLWVY